MFTLLQAPLDIRVADHGFWRPLDFRFFNIFGSGKGMCGVRLTVDTPEDLAAFRNFVRNCKKDWLAVSYLDAVRSAEFKQG